MGMELSGRKVGIVGFGGIGRRFAALAKAIGMEVMVWTRNPDPERARAAGVEFVSLERLLAECDVISLHVAGTPENRGHDRRRRDRPDEGGCGARQHRTGRTRR